MRIAAVAGAVAAGALAFAPSAGAISFVPEGTPYATGAAPYGVLVPDFNADSLPDVATVNGTASNLSVFLRQAGGGFGQETNSPFGLGSGPNFGAVADFNADGRPDVATSNFASSNVTILLRQAGGGFAEEAGSPVQLSDQASAIAAADFTGDSRPDLAVANWNSNQISVLHREAAGGFTIQENYPVGGNPRHLAVGDFNGDGRPDLAVVDFGTDDVTILLRQAGGGFAPETPAPTVGDQPANAVVGDFNGDGRPDLAVSNFGSSTVSILLRRATNDGFTQEGSAIPVGTGPIGLGVGDFDRDGFPDLAVANNSAGSVTILRRAGNTFTPDPASPITVGSGPWGIAVADFDLDTRPDVAVGHDAASELRVLLNTTPLPPDPPPPDPGDIDGDGVPDPDDRCPTVPANTADGCPVDPPVLPPPPTLGETANAALVKGEVLIGIPTGSAAGARVSQKGVEFVPLTDPRQIPLGAFLDTREGIVSLTLARDAAGRTQSGEFAAGLFQVLQKRRQQAKGLTTLQLKGSAARFGDCRAGGKGGARASQLSRRAIRRLRARARGRYRTRGRHSAATVRGTVWTTVDRCDGTLTKVRRGKVAVRDFRLKKTIVVKRGKRYLARARP